MYKIKSEEWKDLLDHLAHPLIIFNKEGKVIHANKIICNLLKCDLDSLVGSSIRQFFSNILENNDVDNFLRVIFEGDIADNNTIEFETQAFGGYYLFKFNAIVNNNGDIEKVVCIATDLTKKKEIEEELKKAKEIAEKNDKMKSSFLANMSHEVRTPLNGIIGFSSMLDNDNLTSEKRKLYVEYIQKGARQLLALINDIIDFSKVEAGLLEVKKQPIDLVELIKDQVVYFKDEIKKQNKCIELKSNIEHLGSDFIICADEIRLRQVLSNLITNAIKFTCKGYIEIGVLIQQDKLLFYVKDTGIGIDKDKLEIIFERYKQAHDYYSKEYGGSGLGLAICKAIVNLMGGNIWVESEKNLGSVFYFTIPLEIVNHNNYNLKNTESNNDDLNFKVYDFKNKKILIVEDDLYNIEFLKAALSPSGAKLLIAKNFKEVKHHLSKDISIVILDIRLPEKDGYYIADYIKEYYPELPIIIHTAYALEEHKEKAIKKGFNEYLIKPVQPSVLLNTINKYIYKECFLG